MKVGDVVTIKNKAGMLQVHIEKELDFYDVTRGKVASSQHWSSAQNLMGSSGSKSVLKIYCSIFTPSML